MGKWVSRERLVCRANVTLPKQLGIAVAYSGPTRNCCENQFPVGKIPVFTLIRTDTTLDLSQKAEKV